MAGSPEKLLPANDARVRASPAANVMLGRASSAQNFSLCASANGECDHRVFRRRERVRVQFTDQSDRIRELASDREPEGDERLPMVTACATALHLHAEQIEFRQATRQRRDGFIAHARLSREHDATIEVGKFSQRLQTTLQEESVLKLRADAGPDFLKRGPPLGLTGSGVRHGHGSARVALAPQFQLLADGKFQRPVCT
jgi:hypothetical protein